MSTTTIPDDSQSVDDLYKLLGTEFSLFTAKVRAYLQWKKVPYCEVLATSDVYLRVIRPHTGATIIPVLVLPGLHEKPQTIQDSKDIMDHIHARFPSPALRAPAEHPKLVFADMLAELVADEWLVLHTMYYRWSPVAMRPYYEFEFGSTMVGADSTPEERLKNGAKASSRFATMLPSLGVTPRTIPLIEAQYAAFLGALNQHLTAHAYVLGLPHPTLADFALYGALYGHSFRDPVLGGAMKLQAPYVAEWVERMGQRLHGRQHERVVLSGSPGAIRFVRESTRAAEATGDGEVPKSVDAWIRVLLNDFLPQLLTTTRKFREWTAANVSSKPLPRAIGHHTFTLRQPPSIATTSAPDAPGSNQEPVSDSRATALHPLWMVQRIVDRVYREHVDSCDAWLADAAGRETAQCWRGILKELDGMRLGRVGASVEIARKTHGARL